MEDEIPSLLKNLLWKKNEVIGKGEAADPVDKLIKQKADSVIGRTPSSSFFRRLTRWVTSDSGENLLPFGSEGIPKLMTKALWRFKMPFRPVLRLPVPSHVTRRESVRALAPG